MKTANITIEGKNYILKLGLGALLLFEEQENKTLFDIKSKLDIIKLAYSSLIYNNKDFNYTLENFIDNILENNVDIMIDLVDKITSLLFENTTKEISTEEEKKSKD